MLNEGKINDLDNVIENCSSYYDINQNSFINNNISISKKKKRKSIKGLYILKNFAYSFNE